MSRYGQEFPADSHNKLYIAIALLTHVINIFRSPPICLCPLQTLVIFSEQFYYMFCYKFVCDLCRWSFSFIYIAVLIGSLTRLGNQSRQLRKWSIGKRCFLNCNLSVLAQKYLHGIPTTSKRKLVFFKDCTTNT